MISFWVPPRNELTHPTFVHFVYLCSITNYRKPSVVTKHSGLDESGDSNDTNEDCDLHFNSNGRLDVTRLPKGRYLK